MSMCSRAWGSTRRQLRQDERTQEGGRFAKKKQKRGTIVAVSLRQTVAVGVYVLKQRLTGRKRYPLVLMLEPLFRCNQACFGCGKID